MSLIKFNTMCINIMSMCAYIYICMYVCMRVCVCVCVSVYAHMHGCMYSSEYKRRIKIVNDFIVS